MQSTLNKFQLALKITDAYIAHVQETYPDKDADAERLILVLKIYRWHLFHRDKRQAATGIWLTSLKHGVREAELILLDIFDNESARMHGWYWCCEAKNEPQRLANLLSDLIMELTIAIQANEALYPHLKDSFDKERELYRKRLEDYREAAAL